MKLLAPVLLLLFSQCKIHNKNSKEDFKTGAFSISEVKHYKWFKPVYRNYHFSKVVADSLTAFKGFSITIIGGEWCSDTRLQLPQFVKILETIRYPEEKVKIILVDRKKECFKCEGYSKEKYNITLVPTFIVFDRSGKEKGRIIEKPSVTLEDDLLKIFNQQ